MHIDIHINIDIMAFIFIFHYLQHELETEFGCDRTQNTELVSGEGGIKPMTWELQQVALLATVGG